MNEMTADHHNGAAVISFTANHGESGKRIDLSLTDKVPQLSRSRVQKLIEIEMVKVNGKVCLDKNYRLQKDDLVLLSIPEPEQTALEPDLIRLDIIYEDADLLVVNKSRGMVVHPAPGHKRGTLVNALLAYCSDLSGIGGILRPGIVHRLDKDTSGLLIVAKNDFAHHALSSQLKARKIKRQYIALVCGIIALPEGRIEAPIGRHPRHRKQMAVVSGGRMAATRYQVLRTYNKYTLLRLDLETGRTHQIRVHLAYLGHPVIGDPVYGVSCRDLPAALAEPQALHASSISFFHPRSGERISFSAPLPDQFKGLLAWLNLKTK